MSSWLALGAPGAPPVFTLDPGKPVTPRQGEVVIAIDDIPSGAVVISQDGMTLEAFVPDLALARSLRWNDAKAYRDAKMNGTCSTPAGAVQIDDASKLKINGAVNMAMLAAQAQQPYGINFTMADNSVVALDAKGMIQMGVAVGQFVAACQDTSTAVRAAIDAATTPEAVQSVDITLGYPN